MERTLEKLDDFEDDLENAYEWPDDHKGDRRKSCSSRKKVFKLKKACEKLRDAYENEFEGDSSADDDDGWRMGHVIHQVGIPNMEEKEVQKEVGQKSLEEPLDTPNLPLEYTHGVQEEDPLLKLMLFAYGKCCYPICGEKHVIHNHDVVHVTQSPLELVNSKMNALEELFEIRFLELKFVEEEFLKTISIQEESPPKRSLQVKKVLQRGLKEH
ncbi:hypothetical protein GOP47_0030844 [Adiantum capillus-veneris]|nr:hypothetical protein GOP47_0030844 [Adiantum capillus-veneris]